MSNQVEIAATITLKPEAVEIINFLSVTRYADDPSPKGRWQQTAERFPIVAEFAQNDRADFIPFGAYGDFENEFLIEGMKWEISCSTGNKKDELQAFLEFLPKIADQIDLDAMHEGFAGDYVVHYELKNNIVVETGRENRY